MGDFYGRTPGRWGRFVCASIGVGPPEKHSALGAHAEVPGRREHGHELVGEFGAARAAEMFMGFRRTRFARSGELIVVGEDRVGQAGAHGCDLTLEVAAFRAARRDAPNLLRQPV